MVTRSVPNKIFVSKVSKKQRGGKNSEPKHSLVETKEPMYLEKWDILKSDNVSKSLPRDLR